MKYPLVYVEWDDHHSDDAWQKVEEWDHSPAQCFSVGWLFKEDERGITIIGCYGDQVGNMQYILKPCITKMTVLRKARVKKVKNGKPVVAVPDAGS